AVLRNRDRFTTVVAGLIERHGRAVLVGGAGFVRLLLGLLEKCPHSLGEVFASAGVGTAAISTGVRTGVGMRHWLVRIRAAPVPAPRKSEARTPPESGWRASGGEVGVTEVGRERGQLRGER